MIVMHRLYHQNIIYTCPMSYIYMNYLHEPFSFSYNNTDQIYYHPSPLCVVGLGQFPV